MRRIYKMKTRKILSLLLSVAMLAGAFSITTATSADTLEIPISEFAVEPGETFDYWILADDQGETAMAVIDAIPQYTYLIAEVASEEDDYIFETFCFNTGGGWDEGPGYFKADNIEDTDIWYVRTADYTKTLKFFEDDAGKDEPEATWIALIVLVDADVTSLVRVWFADTLPGDEIPSDGLDNFVKDLVYTDNTFTDVSATDAMAGWIAKSYEYGIIAGIGNNQFGGSRNMLVQDAIVVAVKMHMIFEAGNTKESEADGFTYPQSFIDYAQDFRLIGDEFAGQYTRAATRAELVRIWSYILPDRLMQAQNKVNSIPDVKDTDKFYREIIRFYEAGMLTGNTDGTFGGEANVRREHAVVMFVRLIELDERVKGETFGELSVEPTSTPAPTPTPAPNGGGIDWVPGEPLELPLVPAKMNGSTPANLSVNDLGWWYTEDLKIPVEAFTSAKTMVIEFNHRITEDHVRIGNGEGTPDWWPRGIDIIWIGGNNPDSNSAIKAGRLPDPGGLEIVGTNRVTIDLTATLAKYSEFQAEDDWIMLGIVDAYWQYDIAQYIKSVTLTY
jgi:hypothetical protein